MRTVIGRRRVSLNRKTLKILAFAAAAVIAAIAGARWYDRLVGGRVEALAENLAVSEMERMIASAAAATTRTGAAHGADGSYRLDPARINGEKERYEAELCGLARKARTLRVKIPLGTLLGGQFLSGKGPGVPARVFCDYRTVCTTKSGIRSTGINQTLYSVRLAVKMDCTLYLPGGEKTVTVTDEVILEEMIFIGDVPVIGY